MDSLLFTTALIQYGEIWRILKSMQPILNINENDIFIYRYVIIFKLLLTNYSMISIIPKYVTLLLVLSVSGCAFFINSELTTPWIYLLAAAFGIYALPFFGQRFEIAVILMCTMSMNIKPCEFLLDVFILFCAAWYLSQAYGREIQKLCTVVILMLTLIWYVCEGQRVKTLNFKILLSIACLLVLLYYPLKPDSKSKHKRALMYLYAVMFMWIYYKGRQVTVATKAIPLSVETVDIQSSTMSPSDLDRYAEAELAPDHTHPVEFLRTEITTNSKFVTEESFTQSPYDISDGAVDTESSTIFLSDSDINQQVEPTSETANPQDFSSTKMVKMSSFVTEEFSTESLQETPDGTVGIQSSTIFPCDSDINQYAELTSGSPNSLDSFKY